MIYRGRHWTLANLIDELEKYDDRPETTVEFDFDGLEPDRVRLHPALRDGTMAIGWRTRGRSFRRLTARRWLVALKDAALAREIFGNGAEATKLVITNDGILAAEAGGESVITGIEEYEPGRLVICTGKMFPRCLTEDS